MKKYLLGVMALSLGIGFSSFTKVATHKKGFAADQYYLYTGPQTPADRKIKANYTSPSTSQSCGLSGSNECVVKVTNVPTPIPTTLTSFNVTFNSTTGFPIVATGTDVIQNVTKQ